jgi:hypothetical protein
MAGSGGVGGLGTALYFMKKENERNDQMVLRHRRRMARKGRRARAGQQAVDSRLDETEADLGRTLLLTMSVNQILVRKGFLSPAEIAHVAGELDMADGIADGKLDPATVRPPNAADSPAATSPEEFFRRLEQDNE